MDKKLIYCIFFIPLFVFTVAGDFQKNYIASSKEGKEIQSFVQGHLACSKCKKKRGRQA